MSMLPFGTQRACNFVQIHVHLLVKNSTVVAELKNEDQSDRANQELMVQSLCPVESSAL